jgi:PAS domain S-box-containing protein
MGKGQPIYNPRDMDTEQLRRELEALQLELDAQSKKLEASRREARAEADKYAELYEFSPVPMLTLDPRGRILECNLAAAELLDHPRARLIDRELKDFIKSGFHSSFKEYLTAIFSSYTKHQLELACHTQKNRSMRVQAVGLSIPGGQGCEKCCRVALTDISLQMERKKLETIITNSPVGIAVTDAEGGTILANRIFEEIWGKDRPPTKKLADYTAYKAWWADSGREVLPEEWASAVVMRTGKPVVDQEMRIRCFDGTYKVINNSAVPLIDADGKISGSVVAVVDITERRHIEEALRTSEERLRLAQVSAGAGVWSWDVARDRLEWSAELFSLFGLDARNTTAGFEVWRSVLHPGDKEEAEKRIETAIATHTPLASEYRIILPSGAVRCIIALGNTIYDQNGTPLRMTGICIDVSERKRLEEELKKNNEELEERVRKRAFEVVRERQRLFSVLESLPVYVVLLTEDYRLPFANKFFIDRFGDSEGRRCFEYLFNRDTPCENCETYKVLKTRQPQNWEWTGPDGRIYDIYDYPFPEADGTTMILEMGIDITKRKQAEAELIKHREHLEELVRERSADLQESTARLQITQEIAHLGSWELDLAQNRLTWSAETYRIFGVDPREFSATYEAFLELVHPDDRAFLDKVFKESIRNASDGYEIEHRLIRKSDGMLRIVHEKCVHIRDDAGSVVRSLGMVHDITQRKAAEDVLARDKKTLETMVQERTRELLDTRLELEKAKRLSDIGTLAATVAHELRNPLATINMAAYNIGKKAQNPLLEKYLENIRKKVQESDQIINNLLFYSRLKIPQYEDMPLNPVIEECVHLCRNQFGTRKRLSIRQRIGPTERMVIQADQLQVKELLSNILNNSCDALSPDGGRIEVFTENNSKQVRIVIRDNGAGIDKQYIEKIFDPFFTTKAKGTGLGLAVCRQIVSLHGGTIQIESERGRGTAFHILLPVRRESADA